MIALLLACKTPEPSKERYALDVREACADHDPNRKVLWGDLHVHTGLSFDAWIYDVRTRPDDAYRFARGEPVDVPLVGAVQLDRPLDFAAVTDHAEYLGEISGCTTEGSDVYDLMVCQEYREATAASIRAWGTRFTAPEPTRWDDICTTMDCLAEAGDVWSEVQQAAEDHYDRTAACGFTSFVGYEWTGATAITNLHRNVIFRSRTVPALPTTYFEQPTPWGLWETLDRECTGDCDVLAIPHNSNLSGGRMFWVEYPQGYASEAEAAAFRARMEPLVEIYQHKGSSECKDGLSGVMGASDEECGFEQYRIEDPSDCGDMVGTGAMAGLGCESRLDFVRNALLEGVAEKERIGENPYEMGIIASTDTHSGTPGYVVEEGFVGHLGNLEATPEGRLIPPGLNPGGIVNSGGGLAAVWAEENSRDSIFDALRRKETYGTSGPRMTVRLFAGDYPDDLCDDPDLVEVGYRDGVPMGGSGPGDTYVVSALKDAQSADLERIQLVKGWVDEDGQHYEVIDVAGQPVDDPNGCKPKKGESSLCAVWKDPDPKPASFVYARVLEVPTCRWSTHDCAAADPVPSVCDDPAILDVIRERAWTSPIWKE